MILRFNTLRLFCLLIPILIGVTSIQSCGPKEIEQVKPDPKPTPDPDPDPEPEPPKKPKSILYQYSSEKNVEFREFHNGNSVKDLTEGDVKVHFGNRVTYFKMDSILVKEDSMFVYRSKMPDESYQIKWNEDELQTYDSSAKTWKTWASRNTDSTLNVEISFYKKSLNNKLHSNLSIGQQYALTDYTIFLDKDGTNSSKLIWLRRNFVFNPIKK